MKILSGGYLSEMINCHRCKYSYLLEGNILDAIRKWKYIFDDSVDVVVSM